MKAINIKIPIMNNYETFYQLHHQQEPLIIANAWNVKSARLIEENGYKALATSSGAVANSLGYEDGEQIPFNELLYVVKRIKASTSIPLSVDLERGYTHDVRQLIDNVQQLLDAGVSGINLEDAQGEETYLKKLSSIKNHLEQSNQKLFINARTDGFLQKVEMPLETTIRRAKLYQDAGADGLFVIALSDPEIIKAIAQSTTLPLNVVGTPKLSSIKTLAECGVHRISMAVFLYRSTYNKLDGLLKAVTAEQSLAPLY
jgi:2-methylisocitrate lyase-like PEP mutase family enzyme